MCFRENEEAKLKCKECSSEMFDAIICGSCATQCHNGHTLSPSPAQLCRCIHRDVTNTSVGFTPQESIASENVSLLPSIGVAVDQATSQEYNSKIYLIVF